MHSFGMAGNAGTLSDSSVPWFDLNGLMEILQRESQRMIEAVVGLCQQRAQMIVRQVAVVADRHMAMG